MQVYLVGGAVRDELLGLPVRERDWVVVGATPQFMERQGYRPAGRDFPVYLHPQSHEEYALARLERKVGPGYRGFRTEFSANVTLEEDLRRRDLTINAMARTADGQLIDPYGGQADLQARVLRHVSEAFIEDPVRILRVARFAARLAPLGFHVAAETRALMTRMVAQGEVSALVRERVWKELERALGEAEPARCFEVLNECGALRVLAPQLLPLFAADGPGARVLAAASALGAPAPVRWAALLAGLGTTTTDELCVQLHTPLEYRELAVLATRLESLLTPQARAPTEPAWLLSLYELADAFRRPARFALWLQVLAARAQAAGAAPADRRALQERLQSGLDAAAAVHVPPQELAGLRGPAIGARLHALRLAAIGQH